MMTQDAWLTSKDSELLFSMVQGTISEEQLRLYVCKCCRRIWHRLVDLRSRHAVTIAERFARSEASVDELDAARKDAQEAWLELSQEDENHPAAAAAYCATLNALFLPAAANRVLASVESKDAERVAQADLLRSIVGNPFRTIP